MLTTTLRFSCARIARISSGIRWSHTRPAVILSDLDLPQLSDDEMKKIDDGLNGLRLSRRNPYIVAIKPLEKDAITEIKKEIPVRPKATPESETSLRGEKKQSLLYDMPIERDGLSDRDYRTVKSLKVALSNPNNTSAKDVNTLINDIGLTKDDRKLIDEEMKRVSNSSGNACAVKISQKEKDAMDKLEHLMRDDKEIFSSFEKWMKEVDETLGHSVSDPNSLTQEEMQRIPPAPRKLREIADLLVSGSDRHLE